MATTRFGHGIIIHRSVWFRYTGDMKALVLTELKQPLQLEERADPELAEGVVVELKAAALNRRDYWITQGMYPGITMPVILGSDGAGVVDGRDVIINSGIGWGGNEAVQDDNYRILGMPDDGTFATHVVVPAENVLPKPDHLNWHEAASLSLGGLTAYRALFTQGGLTAGGNLLISGVGGGVATFALQFGVAAGANVFVTSSSDDKIERAIALGAKAGFSYRAEDWHKAARGEHGPMNVIIDSAGGPGYNNLIDLAAPGGRIVNYGATAGPLKELGMFKVFWKQLHLIGSTMGSPADFDAMLAFVNEQKIRPVIDRIFPLVEGNAALQRMSESKQFGKIVLEI